MRAPTLMTRDVTAEFGWYVKSLRRARGLTREQLADRSGLSTDTIRRLEHGSFSPSLDTITDLLASRSPRDYRLADRVLRTLLDELDGQTSIDDHPSDDGAPSESELIDDQAND